ncbi:MAG: STAS domain-containing protein [Bacteroidetes bacterium]|nr:STAS domain-containing protein [Bacteroidota bacterium]
MSFNYIVTEHENYAHIKLEGELIEKSQSTSLLVAIEQLLSKNIFNVIIDMEHLKYMNSSGLNTLIQILTKTRTKGGEAVLCSLSKKIEELIVVTKLHSLFKITPNVDDAIKIIEV